MSSQTRRHRQLRGALFFERLEPKILLSADLLGGFVSDLGDSHVRQGYYDFNPTDINAWGQSDTNLHESSLSLPITNDVDASHTSTLTLLDNATLTHLADNPGSNHSIIDLASGVPVDFNQLISPPAGQSIELVFINDNLPDIPGLVASLEKGEDTTLFVFTLDSNENGIDQISQVLKGFDDISAVHIFGHGSSGEAQVGGSLLSDATLAQFQIQLSTWQQAFNVGGDLLFYGCDFSSTPAGSQFLNELASTTGLDIAASDDLTGSTLLGGDWDLEIQTGLITTNLVVNDLNGTQWQSLLTTNASLFLTTDDPVTGITGQTGGITTWSEHEVIEAGHPFLTTAPGASNASFSGTFDLNDFGSSDHIDAIHLVETDLTIGSSNTVDVDAGDLLLSTDANASLTGSDSVTLNVTPDDVFIFRPDTVGDYSSGVFISLLQNVSKTNADIAAISLVETDTFVGDTTLSAGSFIFATANDNLIKVVTPSNLDSPLTSTIQTLVNGDQKPVLGLLGSKIIPANITGLELIESTIQIGDTSVSAGEILISVESNSTIMDNDLAVTPFEVIRLQISSTPIPFLSNTAGTASILFQGSDVSFDTASADITGLALGTLANVAPTGSVTISGTPTEDLTLSAVTSTIADPDGLGTFSYQWLRDSNPISGATGSSYTLGDADVDTNITVQVSYSDGNSTAESLLSAAVGPVANVNDPVTGNVVINGTATEDQTLTADTSGLGDNDGLGTFSYQWKRNGTDISGETASTYTLDDTDVGKNITVRVSYLDGHNQNESKLSAAVGPVANINDNPIGSVLIDGTGTEDNTLTANTSGISDPDGLGSFSYQWQRNGADIASATNSSYVLVDADVNQNIRVIVSYLDQQNTTETLTSAAIGPILNVNDTPTGNVTISGTPTEDNTLTADTSGIADNDGLGAFSYQWQRNGADITGETASSYTLGDADVNKNITVVVRYMDANNTAEMLTSGAVGPVINVNDIPAGSVQITGTATEDNILTADTSTITDDDGLGAFSYQWRRDGDTIVGETNSTYTLDDADVGANISVVVSYQDLNNTLETLTSTAVGPILNVNDLPVGNVVIAGTPTEDQQLTADISGISDDDGLGTFTFQWRRDGMDITGETGNTYTLGDLDVGKNITVATFYTDAQNKMESLLSPGVGPIANVNDTPTGLPTISGTSTEGQTLSADTTGIADIDGLGVFNYQWQRNMVDIVGETNSTYLLANADVGNQIRLVVTYQDGNLTNETLTSADVGPVASAANNPPTGSVTIVGFTTEDQMLTADTSTIADADGLGAFSYQWRRDGAEITGANMSTYDLGDADVGAKITLVVGYTDLGGSVESLISAPTTDIVNINDAPAGAPTISGGTSEGNTLSVDTSSITDDDGLGSFNYQWQRDGIAITGANSTSYVLVDADVDKNIRIVVSYKDGHGTTESIPSAAVGPIINVNSNPTGVPTIAGTAMEDQTLTADISGISDADGLGTFSYQWQRNGTNILNETASSYTLSDADVNQNIRVVVSYLDARNTMESLTSANVGPINNINDDPTGGVNISGTTIEGNTLTADTSLIADNDGLGAFSFQWQRNGSAITGATSSSYVLVDSDVDANLRVIVSYNDGNGTGESIVSAAVGPIQNLNSPATGLPTISGTPTEDQLLTADTSAIADTEGLGTFSYQWQRDGVNISGATGNTYLLSDADVDTQITVATSFTDGRGTVENLMSAAAGPVINVNDNPTGQVEIDGILLEGNSLTADTSNIADDDGLGSFSYQWQRDGIDITGAEASSYLLVFDDVGHNITVQVGYTDNHGAVESLTSDQVGPIVDVNTLPTGSVTITGSAIEDQILTADTSLITDPDGIGVYSFQWLRDGVNISGANASTYQPGDDDVGNDISVVTSYVDGNGSAESLTSLAIGPIQNINDAPSGNLLVTGSTTVTNLLTASTANIMDDDGLGSFSLQWQRDGVDIVGATSSSYSSVADDIGADLTVIASYTDAHGTFESLTSVPLTIVAQPNSAPIAIGDNAISDEDNPINIPEAAGLLVNDTDSDLIDSLRVIQVSNGTVTATIGEAISGTNGGSFTVSATGAYAFNPGDDFQDLAVGESRQTTLTYTVSDTAGAQAQALLTVTVQGVNDSPIAVEDTATATSLQQVTISSSEGLLANDHDPDTSDSLQVIQASNLNISVNPGEPIPGSNGGAFIINADGSFSFNPGAAFDDLTAGSSRITQVSYTLSDGHGGTQTQTLSLLVVGDKQLTSTTDDNPTNGGTSNGTTNSTTDSQSPTTPAESSSTANNNTEQPENQTPVAKENDTSTGAEDGTEILDEDVFSSTSEPGLNPAGQIFNFDTPFVGPGQNAQQIVYNNVDPGTPKEDPHSGFEKLRVDFVLDDQSPNVLSSIAFSQGIDKTRESANSNVEETKDIVVGSFAFSAGLSVGYVVWLVRSGILLSSVMSSLPAWRLVDPLPILGSLGQREDEDTESIQNIVQGDQEEDTLATTSQSQETQGSQQTEIHQPTDEQPAATQQQRRVAP